MTPLLKMKFLFLSVFELIMIQLELRGYPAHCSTSHLSAGPAVVGWRWCGRKGMGQGRGMIVFLGQPSGVVRLCPGMSAHSACSILARWMPGPSHLSDTV